LFTILQDGVLSVTATESSTQSSNGITITNDEIRLTKEEMERMIADAAFWSNLTVTCDENSITEEEMERMIADAERYHQDDLEQQKRAIAGNNLESYCSDTKSKIENVYHPLKRGVVDSLQRVYENSGISLEFSNFLELFRIFSGSYGDFCRNFCIEFRGVREFFESTTPRFKGSSFEYD